MDIDRILACLNARDVRYLLIGGMNFLLRHEPVLTFDVDIWIEDVPANRDACEQALADLDCEWGVGDDDWGPVAKKRPGWLARQSVYCLHGPAGAIDVFRAVKGLGDWGCSFSKSIAGDTSSGVTFHGLSDGDMLACQLALDPGLRKRDRMAILRNELGLEEGEGSDG